MKKIKLRDTKYARELKRTAIGHTRLELLFVKAEQQEEVRISWWPGDKNMANKPADLPEHMLISLLAKGIKEGVLSSQFVSQLIVESGT